ncbi:MAG: rod shape-determining protein RodA, partial [Bacteroidota bacterium]
MAKAKRKDGKGLRGIDWITFSIFLALVGIGWLMIYTVGYGDGYPSTFIDFLTGTLVGRQTIWIGISLLVFLFTIVIDSKFWSTFAYAIYGLAMLLLVAVLIFGVKIKGATSWFYFAGFSFQPSELAKFATCLALAAYLDTFSTDLRELRSQVTAVGLFVLPIGLILLQPDAGSALVFLSFFIVLFREGLSANIYIISLSVIALFILGIIFNAAN